MPAVAVRREEVVRRWSLGQSLVEIAEKMGIGYELAKKDIQRVRKQCEQRSQQHCHFAFGRRIAEHDSMIALAKQSFERSLQDKVVTTEAPDRDGSVAITRRMRTTQHGDPRFLAQISDHNWKAAQLEGLVGVNADAVTGAAPIKPVVLIITTREQVDEYLSYDDVRLLVEDGEDERGQAGKATSARVDYCPVGNCST